MKSYTKLRNTFGTLSLNSSAGNLTLGDELMNDAQRRIMEKYFFNEATATIKTEARRQFYPLPYDYSKLKTGTITIGDLKWTPTEIQTRTDWDKLNVFPYYSDIPNNYYIYGNKFGIWPIPSTTGNVLAYNYKKRVPDLSFKDYITGTAIAKLSSSTITGYSTSWKSNYITDGTTLLTTATTSTNSQLPTYTYDNGSSGIGATITIDSAGVLNVGGLDTSLNDVILIKDEVSKNAPYNGLYKVTTEGTTTTQAVLTRSTDNDATTEFVNKSIFVTNSSVTWTYTNTTNPIIGTTDIELAIINSVLNKNLWIRIDTPNGDGEWYQISSIENDTSMTLVGTYNSPTISSPTTYTIGQMPSLLEDYHDVLIFDALVTYFSSIVDNPTKLKEFTIRRDSIISLMDDYVGTKSLNVSLARPTVGQNPNLYQQSIG